MIMIPNHTNQHVFIETSNHLLVSLTSNVSRELSCLGHLHIQSAKNHQKSSGTLKYKFLRKYLNV
nr:MAG TPA: hypothetical protein [Caudoviricetes sp.]